jgi:hypothetical protein
MTPLIVAVIFVILVAVFVSLLVRRKPSSQFSMRTTSLDKSLVQNKWSEIEQTFSLGGASHLKTSILEADKLVDYTLKARGVKGNTFGERLKNSKSKFINYSDYNNLWFAHKVRNNIAHESMHDLSFAEAKRAIEYFKKALQELGAL